MLCSFEFTIYTPGIVDLSCLTKYSYMMGLFNLVQDTQKFQLCATFRVELLRAKCLVKLFNPMQCSQEN